MQVIQIEGTKGWKLFYSHCTLGSLYDIPQTAEYISTGEEEEVDSFRHFALNVPFYTHFTSPIRYERFVSCLPECTSVYLLPVFFLSLQRLYPVSSLLV